MFKKRQQKGNVIKKVSYNDINDGVEVEDHVDINAINDLKNKQSMRKRNRHDFSEIPIDDGPELIKKSETVKSIEAMIGSQFASRAEDLMKNVSHEKIMQKYIDEKLGLISNSAQAMPSTTHISDGIKAVLDEILATPNNGSTYADGHSKDKDSNDISGLLGETSGLTEVELPIRYKLSNIEDTERARQHLQLKRPHNYGSHFPTSTSSTAHDASYHESATKDTRVDLASFRYLRPHSGASAFATHPEERSGSHNRGNSGNGGNFGRDRDYNTSQKSSHSAFTDGQQLACGVPTVPLPSSQADSNSRHNLRGQSDSHSNSKFHTGMRNDDLAVQRFIKQQHNMRR